MAPRISAAHRDAVYEHIVNRLTGIDDVWLAVRNEKWERATQLGWEYSDFLRLILDDLGWDGGPGRSIELTTPADVQRRVFARLRDLTTGLQASEEELPELTEAREREERNRLVVEACDVALAELGEQS